MKLSVIIPTYQRASSVARLLKSVDDQNFDFKKLEVLVVSNFSDDELKVAIDTADLENFRPRIMAVERKGVNASRNYGIEQSRGSYVLLLDDDCWLKERNYLQKIVNHHDFYKDVCAIGGSYVLPNGASDAEKAYNLISRDWQYIYRYGNNESTRLVGGNVSYKREMLLSTQQIFDESIEYGGSEAEFHKRLSLDNIKMIFIPEFEVYHSARISKESLITKARKQALTHTRYSVDGGGYDQQRKSYQSNCGIWALKLSDNENQYKNIQLLIDLYNWVYHYVINHPKTSNYSLKWKAYYWWSKKSRQMKMVP